MGISAPKRDMCRQVSVSVYVRVCVCCGVYCACMCVFVSIACLQSHKSMCFNDHTEITFGIGFVTINCSYRGSFACI